MLKIDWASSPVTHHRATFERGVVGIRCQIETWTGAKTPDNVKSSGFPHYTPHNTFNGAGAAHETFNGVSHDTDVVGSLPHDTPPTRTEWGTLASLMPFLSDPEGRYCLTRHDLAAHNWAYDPDFDSQIYIEVRREFNKCQPIRMFGYARSTRTQGAWA